MHDDHPRIDSLEAAQRLLASTDGLQVEQSPTDTTNSNDRAAPSLRGYHVHRKLGEGATGTVWLGVRDGMERAVAIKFFRARLGEGAPANRAWREMDLLSQLNLPCLPRVHDFGEVNGRFFIVTDYIEGRTLLQHCTERELNRRECVELLAKVADTVHTLHEHGVIHRDIKPANVLINAHGQPMIIDLGIAMLLAGNVMETLTVEGSALGTPACMAPEQARGDRSQISTRSDVYGLGATAYMVLAGDPPFDPNGPLHEVLYRIGTDQPRAVRELDPSIPRPLGAVLTKAVSPRPGDRYASAADLAAEFRRWLGGDAVEAGRPSVWRKSGRWLRRHPALTTLAACLLLAAMTLVATLLTIRLTLRQPHRLSVEVDGRAVSETSILSRAGNMLRTWPSGSNSGIRIAKIVTPETLGGGRTLVLGFHEYLDEPDKAGRLCLYKLSDLEQPFWTSDSAIDSFAIPRALAVDRGRFRLAFATIADVFTDQAHNGMEIIAIHTHSPYSPTVVRIYDLVGNTLYEAWHDGYLNSAVWLTHQKKLAIAGVNSERTLLELGHQTGPGIVFPQIVMAIEPTLGEQRQQISPYADTIREGEWYKVLYPPSAYDELYGNKPYRIHVTAPTSLFDGLSLPAHDSVTEQGVELITQADWDHNLPGSVRLLIDSRGIIVAREVDSAYRPHNPTLLGVAELDLVSFEDAFFIPNSEY